MENRIFEILKQYSIGVAESSEGKKEVAIHDMTGPSLNNSVVFITSGVLTGRKVGDGMLPQVVSALKSEKAPINNVLHYKATSQDGIPLKCTLICVHDKKGILEFVVSIIEEA